MGGIDGEPTEEAVLVTGLRNGSLNGRGDGEEWVHLRDLGGKRIGPGDR